MQELTSQLNTSFAANVRARRQKLGMTQQQLADILQVHRVRVSEIEAARNEPTLEMVERIAQALETTAPKLLNQKKPASSC